MYEISFAIWTTAIVALGVAIALSIVASRINIPVLGVVAALPVIGGLLVHAFGVPVGYPHPAYVAVVSIELFVLGVTAGSPLTMFVLSLAESRTVRAGIHGGIMTLPPSSAQARRPVDAPAEITTSDGERNDAPLRVTRPYPGWRTPLWVGGEDTHDQTVEVLRGGATIGYLERIAIVGCIAAGRVEGVAVIVAIKGLGRFSELDSPEARERFIIGTLVSLIWGCASGVLLLLTFV